MGSCHRVSVPTVVALVRRVGNVVAGELDDEALFTLMELRLDRADDSFAAVDVDALAGFEWAVATEVAGRQ